MHTCSSLMLTNVNHKTKSYIMLMSLGFLLSALSCYFPSEVQVPIAKKGHTELARQKQAFKRRMLTINRKPKQMQQLFLTANTS